MLVRLLNFKNVIDTDHFKEGKGMWEQDVLLSLLKQRSSGTYQRLKNVLVIPTKHRNISVTRDSFLAFAV
jgi:hypothetical protein